LKLPAIPFSASVAALLFLVGVPVERWLFFASARHAVINYHCG
jgi:DMSO reductase anchor subunit